MIGMIHLLLGVIFIIALVKELQDDEKEPFYKKGSSKNDGEKGERRWLN